MQSPPSLLFVCLGNICRSPLAKAAFRSAAEDASIDVYADSAGTAGYHIGKPPDPRSVTVARNNGIDIDQYRARQISPDDYRRFTHIFALDTDNFAEIRARAPGDATARILLLMDVVEGREGDVVADPYYGDAESFEVTWADVDAAAKAIVAALGAGTF